jgi:high-affinity iron transporter
LVDYVGVDYAMAVADGEVVSEFEYGEMQEFTGLIVDEASALADRATRERLAPLAAELRAAVDARASPGVVAEITARMTQVLLRSPALTSAPAAAPAPDTVTGIYAQQCAGCHGASGRGDGPAVTADMEPAPTDFTDAERARARSLYGLYNTITLGVEGTAMPPFDHLSADQRWALAFLVGAMHIDEANAGQRSAGIRGDAAGRVARLGDLTTAA